MKILCVIDSLGSGGAQRQLVELALGFKEKGHEVAFLTYHPLNFFKPVLDEAQIPVTIIEEANYLKRLLKMRRFIRRYEADTVLSFLAAANFISTLAGFPTKKWKLILGERSANPNVLTNKRLRFYRRFHSYADFVVANSNANIEIVKQVNSSLKDERLRVIYNIVNVPEKVISSSTDGKIRIVVAASYRPVKNLDGLIQALENLPEDYKNKLEINWFGDISEENSYYQENKSKIESLGLTSILKLNNETQEIFEEFAKADFVGLFSHYEGFPNTISEAMVHGKPVIVTKVSDVPLFVKENENGFLADSTDFESLKDALKKAIDSSQELRAEMGEKNQEVAQTYFNRENIVSSYLKLMKDEE